MAKIVCVDFDGVIHSYTSGWKGLTAIPDPPVLGAFEWLESMLDAGFEVAIYSSRSKGEARLHEEEGKAPMLLLDEDGILAIKQWFRHHGIKPHVLEQLKFPTQKPAAMMTIDDRAFCFQGAFPSPEWIDAFKPWNKREDYPVWATYAEIEKVAKRPPVEVAQPEFAHARRVMGKALATDEGLMEGYRSNVAMLLHDRWGITDHERRNRAADEILALIFGE